MSKVIALYVFLDTERKDDFVFSDACSHCPVYGISRFSLIIFFKVKKQQGSITLTIIFMKRFAKQQGVHFLMVTAVEQTS